MCLRHYIKLILESPTTEDKNFHRRKCSSHSKLDRIKWPLGWPQPQFFRGYFLNSCNINATFKLFGSQGCSDDRHLLDFSSIFFKICRFCSSIRLSLQGFIPRGETLELLERGLTVAWFSWANRNSLQRMAINEITSFCIDNRLRQMAFIRVRQSAQRRGKSRLSCMLKYFEIKKLYL